MTRLQLAKAPIFFFGGANLPNLATGRQLCCSPVPDAARRADAPEAQEGAVEHSPASPPADVDLAAPGRQYIAPRQTLLLPADLDVPPGLAGRRWRSRCPWLAGSGRWEATHVSTLARSAYASSALEARTVGAPLVKGALAGRSRERDGVLPSNRQYSTRSAPFVLCVYSCSGLA